MTFKGEKEESVAVPSSTRGLSHCGAAHSLCISSQDIQEAWAHAFGERQGMQAILDCEEECRGDGIASCNYLKDIYKDVNNKL